MHRQTEAIGYTARAVIVAGLLVGSVYLSTQAAVPKLLPGVALGWEALFHVERAGAMLGAVGLVLLVAWRALSGDFPVKLGSIEYAAKEAAADTERLSESYEARIRLLEALAGVRRPNTVENDCSDV
jgi:hypothetical protein